MASAGHVDKDIKPLVAQLAEAYPEVHLELLTPVGEDPLSRPGLPLTVGPGPRGGRSKTLRNTMTSASKPTPGTVHLVGAGPGDPGLITMRAVECLRGADLVLYDYLANPMLVDYARRERNSSAWAVMTPAGPSPPTRSRRSWSKPPWKERTSSG